MRGLLRIIPEPAAVTVGPASALLLYFFLLAFAGPALGDTYKGVLVTPGSGLTIPIVVDFTNAGGSLSGKIKTSSPLTLEGPIIAGEKAGLTCNLKSALSPEVTILMTGTCMAASYEGKFMLMFPKRGRRPGTFKLTIVQPVIGSEPKGAVSPFERKGPSVTTIAACMNENNACMVACPHGDPTAEFLCSNSCIAKFEACKAKKR